MVEIFAQAMVAAGFALMVYNIYRLVRFIRDQHDVISGNAQRVFDYVILAFVIVFALVYGVIFFQNFGQVSIGFILLSGSAFVTLVLLWIFRQVHAIKANTMEMASALSAVIEARDPNLKGHSQHVRNLTVALYDQLPERLRRQCNRTNLEYAAIFHDLGKLGVPESILNKPGKLSAEEWQVMYKHPEIGVKILDKVSSFGDIEDWILYHHERPDGEGYYKVPGDQIPLGARIIAVADVFSAVLMARPYKETSTYDTCIQIMKDVAGTQLDAELVGYFCQIPRDVIEKCNHALPEFADSEGWR